MTFLVPESYVCFRERIQSVYENDKCTYAEGGKVWAFMSASFCETIILYGMLIKHKAALTNGL